MSVHPAENLLTPTVNWQLLNQHALGEQGGRSQSGRNGKLRTEGSVFNSICTAQVWMLLRQHV